MEGVNNCECLIVDKCEQGEICQCIEYCHIYQNIYNTIIDGPNFGFLTISPKMLEIEADAEKNRWWLHQFGELKYACSEFILVSEYTHSKMILHFHIVMKIKDRIKLKYLIQRWYYHSNIMLTKSKPLKGLHYLFKEINDNEELLGDKCHFNKDSLALWLSDNDPLTIF